MKTRVELHIEELRLDGVAGVDRERLVEALEEAMRREFSALPVSGDTAMTRRSISVTARAGNAALARALAGAIGGVVRGHGDTARRRGTPGDRR